MAAVLPQPVAAASQSTPPTVTAPAAPAAPVAEPLSRWGLDESGAFTLLTQMPLSEHGAISGHWQAFDSNSSNGAAKRSPSSRATVDDSSSSSSPPPRGGSDDTQAVDNEEERKQSEEDAWFASESSAPPREDQFVHDSATSALLDFIATLVEGDVTGVELSVQQASIMRYLVTRPSEPMRSLLHSFQQDPSADRVASFLASLGALVSHQLRVEESCRESQLTELAALQSIFGGDARELAVYQTHPITFKVTVVLDGLDCNVELGFAMPASYPDEEPVRVNSFVPPPYQSLSIRRLVAVGDSGAHANELVRIDSLLQSQLLSKSVELVGEASVYSLIEEARSLMEEHQSLLKTSLEAHQAEESGAAARVLQLDSIQVFSRGRIEKLEFAAIRDVQQACDLPESIARALLKDGKWDVQACIDMHHKAVANGATHTAKPNAKVTAATARSAAMHMPPPMGSAQRQVSQSERSRFEKLQAAFAPYVSSATATLSCSACCEEFQLREVAGQICMHLLCVTCWRRMLATHIASGQAFVRCVGFKCASYVEEGLILAHVSTIDYARYRRFLQDSFIQLRGWRWCANPQCDKVASASNADRFAVVSCSCHAQWCFSCGRDGHWPISCSASRQYEQSQLVRELRAKVQTRIGAVKEHEEFVKVDVKLCPQCKTPWERSTHIGTRATRARISTDSGRKRIRPSPTTHVIAACASAPPGCS